MYIRNVVRQFLSGKDKLLDLLYEYVDSRISLNYSPDLFNLRDLLDFIDLFDLVDLVDLTDLVDLPDLPELPDLL
jgi:hypothetical protein